MLSIMGAMRLVTAMLLMVRETESLILIKNNLKVLDSFHKNSLSRFQYLPERAALHQQFI